MISRRVIQHHFARTVTFLLGLVALFLSTALRLRAQDRHPVEEVLSNRSIISMVVGKLPREVIVDKLQRTAVSFDLSAHGLLSLHNAGVPRQIMTVMLDRIVAEAALTDTLDNAAVTAMVNGKLPKEVLVAKIRQTPAAFDVTATGLVSLNTAKVPKDIITMMMHAPLGPERSVRVVEATAPVTMAPIGDNGVSEAVNGLPSDQSPKRSSIARSVPAAPRTERVAKSLLSPLPTESGIHIVSSSGGVSLLEPTSFTSGRSSNVLASALTSGLAPVKLKAVVSSAQASVRADDPSAEFYFVFDRPSAGLSGANGWWSGVSSPNEFTLLRLDAKTDRREATTGSFSALGSQVGAESKSIVPTSFTRLKPGVYRVVPKAPLAPGEYAFIPMSALGQGAVSPRLFDFGIDPANSSNR